MTVRQPRNADIITPEGQLNQQWIRYFEQVARTATAASTAGSKIVGNWGPTDASFPASNYATLDTRNTHPVADFGDSFFNRVYFHGVLPDNYTTGDSLVVALYCSMTSATTGNVNWQARLENMVGLDVDSDSFATAESVVDTVPGTAGEVKKIELTLDDDGSHLDSLIAGNLFRLDIARGGSNGSDTATGDAELHYVQLRIA